MLTTQKLYRMAAKSIKKKRGSDSNYRIAKELEVSEGTARRWRDGATMDDENATKIAVFLNLDPAYVLACINAERAKDSASYPLWQIVAERVKSTDIAA